MAVTTISGPVAQAPAHARGWVRDIVLVVVVYVVYDGARLLLVGSRLEHARTDAQGLMRVGLGLHSELWLSPGCGGHIASTAAVTAKGAPGRHSAR